MTIIQRLKDIVNEIDEHPYRFQCLHTDLDRRTAESLEVQEIKNRTNLLNLVHNQNLLHRRNTNRLNR